MLLTTRRHLFVISGLLVGACSDDSSAPAPSGDDVTSDVAESVDTPEADTAAEPDTSVEADVPEPDVQEPDASVTEPTWCESLGLKALPWSDGPYGDRRHDLAGDFTITEVDGAVFGFKAAFTGCDVVVVVPDTIPISDADPRSVWEAGFADLFERSPRNVHYVFVSRRAGEVASAAATALFGQLLTAVSTMNDQDRAHWRGRVHIAAEGVDTLDSWIGPVVKSGIGQVGFGIDRFQRIRGIGSLADVALYNAATPEGSWPWASSLGYAAHDARYWNTEAVKRTQLEEAGVFGPGTAVVPLWTGQVIEEFAEMDVALPEGLAAGEYDGLMVEIDQRCPNAAAPEVGNCGAWDYLSHLHVYDGPASAVSTDPAAPTPMREVLRGITTYHREGRWFVDATPMMAWLKDGGTRRFRWLWAPPWNKQPTETRLTLYFLKGGSGMRPTAATPLFTGGGFNAAYNVGREPVTVTVPASAKRVELYAVISGHGAGTSQCAEFCDHEHEFTVNGEVFRKDHPAVGNQTGCVDEIENGAVPNQWGTWWFGRGGWCPGQPVAPFRQDVTSLVKDGKLTVTYRGLFGGKEPPDGAGDINLVSHIVVWE
jgi:hypothetical protein